MERYAKIFETKESREASIIELSCLKEALEDKAILYQVVYMCHFKGSSQCLYPERPRDPEICQHISCSESLKTSAKRFQLEPHFQKNDYVAVYVPKEYASQVNNIILPAVHVKAEKMKKVAKELGSILI